MSFTRGEVTADNAADTQVALSEVRNMRMTDQLFASSGGVQLAQHLQQHGRTSTAYASTQPANEVTINRKEFHTVGQVAIQLSRESPLARRSYEGRCRWGGSSPCSVSFVLRLNTSSL